ncbi:MAG: hypothetical protein AAGH99_11045 [Planctomycetota bacterium]
MANYFSLFTAPDSHIDFVQKYPFSLFAYVDGQKPEFQLEPSKLTLWQKITRQKPIEELSPTAPSDWPNSPANLFTGEINHRNTDLYHLILNGTQDFVTGSGSIFQTWHEPPASSIHSAIDLTGEDFAFRSDQVPALVGLLSKVDFDTVKFRYCQWLESKDEIYDIPSEEIDAMLEDFAGMDVIVREAMEKRWGLIWIGT